MESPRVTPPPADFCPYVGLRPFTVAEQPFFFGRRSETRVVAANLFATPLTVFYGPSAVGKSSVLQAGVIPQLRREAKTAVLYFRDWQHDDYLDRLKAECSRAIALSSGHAIDIDPALPLDAWIDTALEQFRGQLHILLDQFEEYLLYHPDDAPTAFDGELAAAINRRDIGARFLIGLREDGLAKLDRFRKRIPNLLGNALRLRRLSIAAAREAIDGPVRVYNEQLAAGHPSVELAPDLIDAVIEQVRADQVHTGASTGEGSVKNTHAAEEVETAYLQLVMERLWRERTPVNGHVAIQRAMLDLLGGAKAIAKRHFDEHLQRLAAETPSVDDMVCDLFSHLVTPTGSKISQKEGDLIALTSVPADEVRWFLRELVTSRLLRVTDPPERYEIFHDALAKPFLDARNAIVVKRATAAREAELKRVKAMADAERARAEAEAAAREAELKRVQALADAERSRAESEAARVTEQQAATKRFQRVAMAAVLLMVVAIASAVWAVVLRNQAQDARQQAEAAQATAQRAEAEIAAITEKTSEFARQQQARIDELTKQLGDSQNITNAEREQLLAEAQNSKDQLAKLNQQYQQVQRSTPDKGPPVSKDLADARAQVASLDARLRASQSELDKVTAERNDWRDNATRTAASLKSAQAEIAQLRSEVDDLKKRLAAAAERGNTSGGGGKTTADVGPVKNDPKIETVKPDSGKPETATPDGITGDYRTLYGRAMTAFERKRWDEAAPLFAAAARQKGDAKEYIRVYGMRSELYLPNHYLGLTYREMRRCDEALRAWLAAEKAGVVQGDSSAYRALQQGRAACSAKE
jgi:hypothetical protein